VSTYEDLNDGTTRTVLSGVGFDCSTRLEARYLVTSAGSALVAYSNQTRQAVLLASDCQPAQTVTSAYGAMAVADGTAVVLDGSGTPRWIK
jgi:hypothetical protein